MLQVRANLEREYADVLTAGARAALDALAGLDADRKALMSARIARRADRARHRRRLEFLDPAARIARTGITVQEARDGAFTGSEIPTDLQRQWIQGTGPAARPGASTETSLRNVAYALLSGADGWMFDGEDALGQVETMSLDNQRSLKLAIHRDPLFMRVAEQVATEMNRVGRRILRPGDRRRLAPPARLHDEDLPARAGCTSTIDTSATPAARASPRPSSTRRSTS